ncbi:MULTISPECIES: hypothetical protein [unclassified Frankia]|uniref:hypothetical protein n=1 Tax=unclassified Frankia TaxID=2632575 RepID=UPI002AD221B8|nr:MULTISPECIES: hypothetical protein [unclassified Frankia]
MISDDSTRPAPRSLEEELQAAASEDFKERADAARALAGHLDVPVAFNQLVTMLDDADIAVIEVAVEVLAIGGGIAGLTEVLRALGANDDNAGYHIRDKLASLWLDGIPILDRCQEILSQGHSGAVREGVSEMIEILT